MLSLSVLLALAVGRLLLRPGPAGIFIQLRFVFLDDATRHAEGLVVGVVHEQHALRRRIFAINHGIAFLVRGHRFREIVFFDVVVVRRIIVVVFAIFCLVIGQLGAFFEARDVGLVAEAPLAEVRRPGVLAQATFKDVGVEVLGFRGLLQLALSTLVSIATFALQFISTILVHIPAASKASCEFISSLD